MERLAVDRDVAVDRGDDDVAMKGDAPYRFRQVQRMGERVPSASRHTRTVSSPPLAITGVPSRGTPTAIALAAPVGIFQRKQRKVEVGSEPV
jgi:adenine/guanine phosphoribosyltransferase-like PRPP-binding protein